MTDIFQEVDEEVRAERYKKLWQKYGWVVIAAAVLLVIGVGGYEGWKAYRQDQQLEESVRYSSAMDAIGSGNAQQGIAELEALAEDGSYGYSELAAFEAARARIEAGEVEVGVAAYREIAADGSADPSLRAMARFLAVMNGLEQGNPADLQAELAPLIEARNPLRPAALQLSAMIALQQG
ncbi:MAG: tetratricopeptide repeat protein, partial [Rhodovibrionaceae bacterium]